MWFRMACRRAFKWWERMSSTGSVADLPQWEAAPRYVV